MKINSILILNIILLTVCGTHKNNSTMNDKTYERFIDLAISHPEMRKTYYEMINKCFNEKDYFFKNADYIFRNRKELNVENDLLASYVIFDLMEDDQYLIPLKSINNKEILWHWLSVFAGNNNIPNIRQHLTDEIYDNNEYKFDIYKSSILFQETDYLIYSISFDNSVSMGVILKEKFNEFISIGKKLNYEIHELK